MNTRFAGDQIIGDRERQEDAYAILDLSNAPSERLVLTIADGMGGHPRAADVARLAVRSFCQSLKSAGPPSSEKLGPALNAANNAIAIAGLRDPSLKGAGCTLLGVMIENSQLLWISVGDCILYHFRGGRLQRLNDDHSFRSVRPPRFWSRARPNLTRASRTALRSALTGNPVPLVDAPRAPVLLEPGDSLLLASDGIETINPAAISRILLATDLQEPELVLDRLLTAIGTLGTRGQDNTTVIFCRLYHS